MDTNIIIQDTTKDVAAFSIIRSMIHEIRGQKVMLDFDLAEMYRVETKNLKRAVRRNAERFPDDFMFELTQDEVNSLRCNFGTLETGSRGQHTKYLPFAFTEQGVAQLSSVLNSNYPAGAGLQPVPYQRNAPITNPREQRCQIMVQIKNNKN